MDRTLLGRTLLGCLSPDRLNAEQVAGLTKHPFNSVQHQSFVLGNRLTVLTLLTKLKVHGLDTLLKGQKPLGKSSDGLGQILSSARDPKGHR